MSMAIQRQNEAYSIFDDGPRYAKEYSNRDLPAGLAHMLRPAGIQAGFNSTDPTSGSHPVHPDYYAPDSQAAMTGISPQEQSYMDFGHDPHTSLPEGEVIDHGYGDQGYGLGHYEDYDPNSPENLEGQFPDFREARRFEAEDGGPAPALISPNQFQPGSRLDWRSELNVPAGAQPSQEQENRWQTAAQPTMQTQAQPAQMGWVGHGFAPGHRVGLPWRNTIIPGVVTHLPGQQVGVRWDDSQHSTEEPADLRPL